MYEKLYYLLFNAITDALESLREPDSKGAEEILVTAQQRAEEFYLNEEETD